VNIASVDIKDFLVAAGVGTFGTDLFVSEEPQDPDAVVTVYDTGGFDSEASYEYERPTVQVRIRGAKGGYIAAANKAIAIKAELHGKYSETINNARYIGIWMQGDILPLGDDEKGRPVLTVNFRIHRTSAT
jgi:hypothetical protein